MKSIVVRMEPRLVNEVDQLVHDEGLYRSRNAFVRDAVRARLVEIRAALIREKAKPAMEKLKQRGYKPREMTREERDAALDEYLKSKGVDPKEFK